MPELPVFLPVEAFAAAVLRAVLFALPDDLAAFLAEAVFAFDDLPEVFTFAEVFAEASI